MIAFFQKSPFLRLLLPFILGIVIAYRFSLQLSFGWIYVVFILLAGLLILSLFIRKYSFRWVFGMILSMLSFWTAIMLTVHALNSTKWIAPQENHTYCLKLIDDPIEKAHTWMCKARIIGSDTAVFNSVFQKQIIIYLPKENEFHWLAAGGGIVVNACLEQPKILNNGNFDYPSFLRKQGIAAVGFAKSGQWFLKEMPTSLFDNLKLQALECRRQLVTQLKEIIPNKKNAGVGEAMFIGYKADMDSDLKKTFASTGAAHILSVSGLHLSVLFFILCFIFSLFGCQKKMQSIFRIIILLLLWIFTFITGLSPSIVRACIMICFVGIGTVIGKRSVTINTIAAAALFMMIYNPLYLFDLSFQLSYGAVFGIVLINPYAVRLLQLKSQIMSYLWELSCVSTSAQVGTAPIAIYYFHQLPVIFILTNIFAIPLVGILLLLIPLSLLLHGLYHFPTFIFLPLNVLLEFFISGIELLNTIPFAVISDLFINEWNVYGLYATFIFVVLFLMNKRAIYLYLIILLVAIQLFYYL